MKEIMVFLRSHPILGEWLKLALIATATVIALIIVLRLERKAAKKLLYSKKNVDMNVRFVERTMRFILVLVAVQWVIMSSSITQPFGKVLFQGTTVIAAVAGFAAQPVIADLICGMIMSTTKPFDMGDRIELEDGTTGIVKDINMRHVVLQGPDTMEIVIPNSKLNSMKLSNMSRSKGLRSIYFRFHVAYHTDVDQAMEVIRQAIEESPYSVPGRPGPHGPDFAPVYFMEYAESSLVLTSTVYYAPTNPTEFVKSDINARVKRALEVAGIEIPYNYVNVVVNDGKKTPKGGA